MQRSALSLDREIIATEDETTGHEALNTIQAAWNSAACVWNPYALSALFVPDAIFFGGKPGHFVGINEIENYFMSYIGIIKSAKMELQDQHVMKLGSETFLAQGCGKFSFLLADDLLTKSLLRTTFVIVFRQGKWKICQQHISGIPSAPPLC